MSPELIIKHIETYSNAIIAFTALQSIAFSYAFGTNELFNCLIRTANYLAEGLAALFLLIAILSFFATVYLGNTLRSLSESYESVVKRIYFGKLVVVVIFSLLPLALVVGYGVAEYTEKTECNAGSNMHVSTGR